MENKFRAPQAPQKDENIEVANAWERFRSNSNPPMQHVNGLYFRNEKIFLSGYTFFRCRFDNCKLIANGSFFNINSCIIDPSTDIAYANGTEKIIQLFLSKYDWSYSMMGGFAPQRNADGTITIEGTPL